VTRANLLDSRWCPRALAVVLAAAALLVGAASSAQAHNILVGTSPANGTITKVVPPQVTLTFNEPALAVGTEIIVSGPGGPVQTGAAVLLNNTVTEHLQAGSPAGQYTVLWRVTSADGHPVSGKFSFTATSASPGQRPSATTTTDPLTSTSATGPGQSSALWWVVAGGIVVLMLLVVVIKTRRPLAPHDERDPES
jgi:methionine-rich copper-binding protein CopC